MCGAPAVDAGAERREGQTLCLSADGGLRATGEPGAGGVERVCLARTLGNSPAPGGGARRPGSVPGS